MKGLGWMALLLVVVGGLTGCADPPPRSGVGAATAAATAMPSSSPAPPPRGWTTFASGDVSFDHPTAWTEYPTGWSNPGGWSAVSVLSTTAFGATCAETTDTAGSPITACHLPEPDLGDGGTFVDWTWRSSPIPYDSASGRYVGVTETLDGRDAVVDRATLPLECKPTHAVSGEVVAIDAPPGGTLVMTACFGTGDLDVQQADVDRMLASLRIGS